MGRLITLLGLGSTFVELRAALEFASRRRSFSEREKGWPKSERRGSRSSWLVSGACRRSGSS